MSEPTQPVGPWRDPFEADPGAEDATRSVGPPDSDRSGAAIAASEPPDRSGATTAESGPPDAPTAPRGPAAGAILLGVTCLVVAALVLLYQLTVLRVDWAVAGPLTVVGSGALLVLAGLRGLGWARRQR